MPTQDRLESVPITLHELFSGDNELRCPLFQRSFVWDRDNFNSLWQDIDTILDGQYDVRFLGALVFDNDYASTTTRSGLYWIVDGQQRLLTLYLCLVALFECAYEINDTQRAEDIRDQYLISRKQDTRRQPKVYPAILDTRQFNSILGMALHGTAVLDIAHQHGEADGRLSQGYSYLRTFLRSRCVDETGALDGSLIDRMRSTILERIELVEIRLGQKHDANEVFDRLNREGVRLGVVDLVRNEILKRLKHDANLAVQAYAEHWQPFETGFQSDHICEGYFYPYAQTKDPGVTKPKTFQTLARHWSTLCQNQPDAMDQLTTIMRDINEYVPVYKALRQGTFPEGLNSNVRRGIKRLNTMGCPTVVYPYVFRLVSEHTNGRISAELASSSLLLVESFLVRRAFLGLEPTGLHAVFKALWDNAHADPEEVKRHLATRTIEFPSDERFREAVKYGQLYGRKICGYAITELERQYTDDGILDALPSVTIDHVLPQNGEGDWNDKFNPEQKEKWIHTWANLVPLSEIANSERGRLNWAETREKLHNEMIFHTTMNLYDTFEDWNEDNIERRSEELAQWSVTRWPK